MSRTRTLVSTARTTQASVLPERLFDIHGLGRATAIRPEEGSVDPRRRVTTGTANQERTIARFPFEHRARPDAERTPNDGGN
jgi:hypothetical protein